MARFLNTFSQEEIDKMARTYTEGYRMAFVNTGKDLSVKKTVNIRYPLGFERMVRSAVQQFQEMGLKPTVYRYATHLIQLTAHRNGFSGGNANPQFEYDHREGAALFLDHDSYRESCGQCRTSMKTIESWQLGMQGQR